MRPTGVSDGGGSNLPGFLIFSGANDRAVLALCRGFDQYQVPFGLIGRGEKDLLAHSRYAPHYVHHRTSEKILSEDLLKAKEQGDALFGKRPWVVCPTSEYVNLALFEHRGFLESKEVTLATCAEEFYRQLTNKETFRGYAERIGVPPPPKLQADAAVAPLPFVAKPIQNLSSSDKILYPYLVRTPSEREHFLSTADPKEFYLEEFVQGESWYLLLHFGENGEVVHGAQRNVLQQGMGKSIVLARSMAYPEAEVANLFIRALQTDGYRGFIMVELRREADGRAITIEANPRCWGPFQLTLDARMGLLEAFLRDHGYNVGSPKAEHQATYGWLGGIVQALRKGLGLDGHAPTGKVLRILFTAMANDIFARRGSYRCFVVDLWRR